jgi:hypothetical protein
MLALVASIHVLRARIDAQLVAGIECDCSDDIGKGNEKIGHLQQRHCGLLQLKGPFICTSKLSRSATISAKFLANSAKRIASGSLQDIDDRDKPD